MNLDWQTMIALAIVLAAGAAVAMRVRSWLVGSRQSACGAGCSGCSMREDKPLVKIQTIGSLIGKPSKK